VVLSNTHSDRVAFIVELSLGDGFDRGVQFACVIGTQGFESGSFDARQREPEDTANCD
jgi:hypothetical protein